MFLKLSQVQKIIAECTGVDDLELYEGFVVEQFNDLIGYEIRKQTYTAEVFNTNKARRFYFPNRPVTEVAMVEELNSQDEWEELDETESPRYGFQIYDDRHIYYRPCFTEFIRVTYTAGYDAASVPSDIKQALLLQLRFYQARTSEGNLVAKSIASQGSTAALLDADYHPMFKKVALRYRKLH